jgi:hypothetical protein
MTTFLFVAGYALVSAAVVLLVGFMAGRRWRRL